MTMFYANLWEKKLTRLEAMRQAQLSMLRGEVDNQTPLKRGPGAVVKSAAQGQTRTVADASSSSGTPAVGRLGRQRQPWR